MESNKQQIGKDNFVFFLGGYDAEMVTIRQILKENKLPFIDLQLKWGAKLSAYKNELSKLSKEQTPVFIELNLDIEYPSNAVVIDHHNERAGKDQKTSIEQVAELLGVKLDRWQQLISANDKGYIGGMEEYGATEEEIKKVRELDKEKQGVTSEDEEKAKISVEHFLTRISNDSVIIDSQTEKTSAVLDLIYKFYRHIFIITPSGKLSYSGNQQIIEILKNTYSELELTNKNINIWFGGYLPDHGYFGSDKALTKQEIIKIMEPFTVKERIHSQHIFMFPFNIIHDDIKQCNSSFKRLNVIHNIITKGNSGWKYKPFEIVQPTIKQRDNNEENANKEKYSPDGIWAYNEIKYFHEYVQDTLFNRIPVDELFKNGEQPISLYYEREILPSDEMIIFVKVKIDNIENIIRYSLKVDNISIRIFETGIGILSITLYNTCNSDFDSILRINDYGRRIYPQFFGEQNQYSLDPIDAVKNSFLPEKIVFKAGGIDTIDTFETNAYLSEQKHFAEYLRELLKPFHDNQKNKLAITAIIDDRMFVVCWHENDLIVHDLVGALGDEYLYQTSDDWYKYIFLDSGKYPLIQHKDFKKQLIQSSTYPRFTEFGTLFGVTRYSLVCLCSVDKYYDFPYRIIRNHMQKMYYQMAVLLLAQRASIIKFNNELKKISIDADKLISHKHNENTNPTESINEKKLDEMLKGVETLNKDIILFSNRIWFEEVSPEEQGIELYKLAVKNMDIENEYYALRKKVSQLHDFVRIMLENEHSKLEQQKTTNIQRLTVLSIVFAVVVCLLTFWAIDFSFLRYWKGIDTTIINTGKEIKVIPISTRLVNIILMFLFSSFAVGSSIVLISFAVRSKLKFILEKKVIILFIIMITSFLVWILLLMNIIK